MRIEKRSYSRTPWRLVTDHGKEVYAWVPMDHASLGQTVVQLPIAGETKAECTEKALALLERLFAKAAAPAPAA